MNASATCHFTYFPVFWMFQNRKLNDGFNKLSKGEGNLLVLLDGKYTRLTTKLA